VGMWGLVALTVRMHGDIRYLGYEIEERGLETYIP
jgi:hypothetical protein